ncbi:hypothetical protein ACJJVE_06065 [Klebsiella quasipneumoniae]
MTKSTITREQLEEWVAQFDEDGGCDATDRQLEALIRQSLAAMDLSPVAPVCTCPSGDGSLRWPCPAHPGNSPVIGIDLASGPDRTVEVRYVAPPGYVMVPKEATEKMLIAGLEEANPLGGLIDWDASRGDCNTREQVQEIFKAMLAAAPQEVKGE